MKRKFLLAATLLIGFTSACASPAVEPTPEPTATPIPPTATLAPTATPVLPLTLTSAAFENGGDLTNEFFYKMGTQCSGENVSPPLAWSGGPAGTQSFALTVVDPDGNNWVHWVQFNIPTDVTELPSTVGGPEAGVKGRNYFYTLGYGGPCPPGGDHHYVFTLYAVDSLLPLKEAALYDKVMAALDGHVLEEVELIGIGSPQ